MKRTRKITSLILSMLMLISVFAVAPLSASAVERSMTYTRPPVNPLYNDSTGGVVNNGADC